MTVISKETNIAITELRQVGSFKFKGLDKKNYSLTLKQKKFVESYLEFKGNGVQAIYEAGYNPRNIKVAAVMATENLMKPKIIAYTNLKLDEYGYGDNNVEKQHLFLLNQNANLNAKKGAIDMFYKRFGKYAPDKHLHVNVPYAEVIDKLNKGEE